MSKKINPIIRKVIDNRKCCVCGKGTYKYTENRIQWYRDIDEEGKWTGKWKCNGCYSKDYTKERNRQNDLRREFIIKMKKGKGGSGMEKKKGDNHE